jgi:murein DD-endopeptidase MepM/ murein hydrolase activator NlpD
VAVVHAGTPVELDLPEVTPPPDFTATGELHWPLREPGALKQIYWLLHPGIDVAAAIGTSILAADNGVTVLAEFNEVYGNLVIIDHGNGFQTWYGHLDSFDVAPLDGVKQGGLVGRLGSTGASTGPHLHFEVHLNGGPVPPLRYLTDAPQAIVEASVAMERRTATAIARATQTAQAIIREQTATAERAAELTRTAAALTSEFLSRTPTPSLTAKARTPTPSATFTPTLSHSHTPSLSPTPQPTDTITPDATATPSLTPSLTASATDSPEPTFSATPEPSLTPSETSVS